MLPETVPVKASSQPDPGEESRWSIRRLSLAIDAIRRKLGPGSENRVKALLLVVAELEGEG